VKVGYVADARRCFFPLFTIMHNQYVNMVRRAMRDGANGDIEQISSTLMATTHPTASRQLRELERALSRLREEHREVILLIGLEGMSYEAAAQILDVPVGTVRSRLSRGRDAFASIDGHAGKDPERRRARSRRRGSLRLDRPPRFP
jgi:RNA polymerase sigma-70 factor (ECF subfamily)